MNKRAWLLTSVLVMAIGLVGCKETKPHDSVMSENPSSNTISIETAQGPVALLSRPQRVAVFDLASIDTLEALGIHVLGVPDKLYLPFLKKATAGAQTVGTLFEPDLEALHRLKPDLIIVAQRSAPALKNVQKIAPAIDMTEQGTDLIHESIKRIETYGRLFHEETKAKALVAEEKALIARIKGKVKPQDSALILMVNGGKLSAFGENSRFGWIHHDLGFAVLAKDLAVAPHGQPISFEYIQSLNPHWLFVLDRSAAIGREGPAAQSVLDNALVRSTPAWQLGQVIYFQPGSYVALGGVTQMREQLKAIDDALDQAHGASEAKTTGSHSN